MILAHNTALDPEYKAFRDEDKAAALEWALQCEEKGNPLYYIDNESGKIKQTDNEAADYSIFIYNDPYQALVALKNYDAEGLPYAIRRIASAIEEGLKLEAGRITLFP